MKTAEPNDELVFLPLGGSNEIGMNLNCYGYGPPNRRKWIIVDVGVTFGDATTPGVEIIMPDPTFMEDHAKDILGIVLTHAHEDHIGALGWLWPRLKAPLYATPFTAFLIREKLRDQDLENAVEITEVALGGAIKLGPFELELITITHSIPEPNGVAIRTPLGVILHTGDWKIDPDPQLGAPTDVEAIQRLGDEGVLAMVCDSTNVFVDGRAGSEAEVRVAMNRLIGTLKGKVAVACFASNVARMDTAIRAGQANGRKVCLVGRSMHRMAAAARSVGFLADIQPLIDESQAKSVPADKLLLLCTGSQGEPRAALSRIAEGTHPHINLGRGDCVVFSSRVIPGNEIGIRNLPLHRPRPSRHPRVRPPVPRRAGGHVSLGPAADRGADPRRAPTPSGALRPGAGSAGSPGHRPAQRRHGAAGARAGRGDRRDGVGPALSGWRHPDPGKRRRPARAPPRRAQWRAACGPGPGSQGPAGLGPGGQRRGHAGR
jgi:ribonuclease J